MTIRPFLTFTAWAALLAISTSAGAVVIGGVAIEDVSSELIQNFDRGAVRTIDGSGLDINGPGTHSNTPDGTMWLNTGTTNCCGGVSHLGPGNVDTDPQITFDLGAVYNVATLRVWNYNEVPGAFTFPQRGVNETEILVSADNIDYTSLGSVNFAQAPGTENVDFSEVFNLNADARYVRLDIASNHGGDNGFVGLSEVEFDGTLLPAAPAPQVAGVTIADVSSEIGAPFSRDADFLVDGSGLGINGPGTHSTVPDGTMWLSELNDPAPSVTFDLGELLEVQEMRVWNYNELSGQPDNFRFRGADDVELFVSNDGSSFTSLGTTSFFAAPASDTVDFSQSFTLDELARFVRIDILNNHNGPEQYFGLAEVQFFGAPPVPEPATATLLLLALAGLRRRRWGGS